MKFLFYLICLIPSIATSSPTNYIILLKQQDAQSNAGISTQENTRSNMDILNIHLTKVRSLIQSNTRSVLNNTELQLKYIYNHDNFKGYCGQFSPTTIKSIRGMREVELIEEDRTMSIDLLRQLNAPWGLSRLSQRIKKSNDYVFDNNGGSNVNVYVIDTGININHPEFEGRAKWGKTFSDSDDIDDNGHGTHVAGTVGSRLYGVAKKATLVAVKVLNAEGSGAYSDIIAGIQWAAKDAKKNKNTSVANMSLGGEYSESINRAVEAAVKSGLAFAVAAGNDNNNACDYSPASSEYVLSVGASNNQDLKASFSNWGKCVSLFAPGENILSTWNNGKTNTISGTSMASPHVAGLMAYFLSIENSDPFQLYDKITQATTKGQLKGLNLNTNNLLAYNLVE
ncbi:subtilisin-like protease [Neoconidiobolus thromboides FSU 785]|nr:subtilisin-like protease [Neoconidiobolus thromboides FSU 785]